MCTSEKASVNTTIRYGLVWCSSAPTSNWIKMKSTRFNNVVYTLTKIDPTFASSNTKFTRISCDYLNLWWSFRTKAPITDDRQPNENTLFSFDVWIWYSVTSAFPSKHICGTLTIPRRYWLLITVRFRLVSAWTRAYVCRLIWIVIFIYIFIYIYSQDKTTDRLPHDMGKKSVCPFQMFVSVRRVQNEHTQCSR